MNCNSEKAKQYIKSKKIYNLKIAIAQFLVLATFILLWEFLSTKEIINSFLFSSPSSIFKLLKQYIATGELFEHIYISLYETVVGLILGTSCGILVAIILWWSKT